MKRNIEQRTAVQAFIDCDWRMFMPEYAQVFFRTGIFSTEMQFVFFSVSYHTVSYLKNEAFIF